MTKTQESNTSNPMATGNIPKLLAQLAIPAVIAQIIRFRRSTTCSDRNGKK